MKYIKVSGNHHSEGLCSDNKCPCASPGATIPRGEGYIYTSVEVARFRRDALSEVEAERKLGATAFVVGKAAVTPILVCREGAEKRGLDLDVASADARRWWETGEVPCRATPSADSRRLRRWLWSLCARLSRCSPEHPDLPAEPLTEDDKLDDLVRELSRSVHSAYRNQTARLKSLVGELVPIGREGSDDNGAASGFANPRHSARIIAIGEALREMEEEGLAELEVLAYIEEESGHAAAAQLEHVWRQIGESTG